MGDGSGEHALAQPSGLHRIGEIGRSLDLPYAQVGDLAGRDAADVAAPERARVFSCSDP
jgi:hypothetical protein